MIYGVFYGHKTFAVGVTSGYDHQVEIMLEGSQKQKKKSFKWVAWTEIKTKHAHY